MSSSPTSRRTYFRPHRKYASSTQSELGKYASETLGSGSQMELFGFRCPEGVDEADWLAAMMVDVYNNVSHLYGTLTEFCVSDNDKCSTMNAGPKYEYLWADHKKVKKPIKCSAMEYANYLFDWIDDQMTDQDVFPTEPGKPYPRDFKKIVKTMCKKLFRIYAHMYTRHHEDIEMLSIYPYLNSAFKGFLYFCETFDLIDSREVAPLKEHIRNNLGRNYKQGYAAVMNNANHHANANHRQNSTGSNSSNSSASSSPKGRPKIQYAKMNRQASVESSGLLLTPTSNGYRSGSGGGGASPLGDVSTPMSVIYHPDEEQSVSVSQSPSVSSHHLAIISEPVETDRFCEDDDDDEHTRMLIDGGSSSPTATAICVDELNGKSSMSTTVTMTTSSSSSSMGGNGNGNGNANNSSSSSSSTPTPDEIKQRYARLRKKYLEDDNEAPSRSEKYSSSSIQGPPKRKASGAQSTSISPPPPLGDIDQERMEEPRRMTSPRQRIADYQSRKSSYSDERQQQSSQSQSQQASNNEAERHGSTSTSTSTSNSNSNSSSSHKMNTTNHSQSDHHHHHHSSEQTEAMISQLRRTNESLRSENDRLENELYSMRSDLKSSQSELAQARAEIRRLKMLNEQLNRSIRVAQSSASSNSNSNSNSHHHSAHHQHQHQHQHHNHNHNQHHNHHDDDDDDSYSPLAPPASPLPPPIEPPSPLSVSLVTPSPDSPEEVTTSSSHGRGHNTNRNGGGGRVDEVVMHRGPPRPTKSAPTSPSRTFLPMRSQHMMATTGSSSSRQVKPRSTTGTGEIPPPPPPPPLPNHRSHRQKSSSPRRVKLRNAYPRTPEPTAARAAAAASVTADDREEKYEQMKKMAEYSQSARVMKPRQVPHGPPGGGSVTGGTPRISRNRANSNPKQGSFIIRRRNADKPPPQRALPKLPRS